MSLTSNNRAIRETPKVTIVPFTWNALRAMCFRRFLHTTDQSNFDSGSPVQPRPFLPTALYDLGRVQREPTASRQQASFLALPTELRIAVYEAVLLGPRPSLTLLQTCQQVAMEAQPALYQRHLAFSSQAQLFDWIEGSQSSNLKRVRTLTLRLTDVDLSPLFDSKRNLRTSSWTIYQEEMEKLDRALTSLPNVSELTITPPKLGHSQLLKSMYLSFLVLIPRRDKKLKRLNVDDTEAVLETVPRLKELGDVRFSVASKRQQDTSRERHDSAISLPKKTSKHNNRSIRKSTRGTPAANTASKSTSRKRRIRARPKPFV